MWFLAVSIRDYLTDHVSSEQHSSAQKQELETVIPILPEVRELEMRTDVSVIIIFDQTLYALISLQDICRKMPRKKKGQVASGLLNITNPTLTLTH